MLIQIKSSYWKSYAEISLTTTLIMWHHVALIINEINKYIEENNGNKYLALSPVDESQDTFQKYE